MVLNRKLVVTASLVAALGCGGLTAGLAATSAEGFLGATTAFAAEASAAQDEAATCLSVSYTPAEGEEVRTVIDGDGFEVTIPAEVDHVGSTIGAFSQIFALVDGNGGAKTVADIGRTAQTDLFQEVFPNSNPDDHDARNVEDLVASGCQVVIGPGSMYSDEQRQQLAEANIAFVALNMSTVDDISHAVLVAGQIEGDEQYERAQQFVEYYQGWIEDATEITKDADKPTVMQLRYEGGSYVTTNSDDICSAYFEAAGGENVAADYSGESNGTALIVSAEQVLEWNPEYIFVMYGDTIDEIKNDPALSELDAVKNDHIYIFPCGTYLWSVRAGEGAMSVPWLCSILHPDLFPDLDMTQEVKDFFETFYNYELTDEQTAEILAGPAVNEE